jgi:lycopene beta-cyclase
VDHYQYLLVLAACLIVTLPLEFLVGSRLWRQPRRLAIAIAPPLVAFSGWDVAAIAGHEWRYNARYVTGLELPGHLPVEEVAFFVVVPMCALLTFEAVSLLLDRRRPLLLGQRLALLPGRRRGKRG